MDRLNLGSGPWYADGWVNVDPVIPDPPARPPDVQADLYEFAADRANRQAFRQVYLGHVLEHIPWRVLPRFWDALWMVAKPGAEVMVVGPCILRAVQTRQPQSILEAILATPWDGEGGLGHAWTPTEEWTVKAVRLGGLQDVEVLDVAEVRKPEWPNPDNAPWQTAVRATIPG